MHILFGLFLASPFVAIAVVCFLGAPTRKPSDAPAPAKTATVRVIYFGLRAAHFAAFLPLMVLQFPYFACMVFACMLASFWGGLSAGEKYMNRAGDVMEWWASVGDSIEEHYNADLERKHLL